MAEPTLPPCLRWPEDQWNQSTFAGNLPARLIRQLQQCLHAEEPPEPKGIWAAWDARPKQLIEAILGQSSEKMLSAWIEAYDIAWRLKVKGESPPDTSTSDPYANACAMLLASMSSRKTIPIVTVNRHSIGRLQELVLDIVNDDRGLLFLNPNDERIRKSFDSDFLSGIQTAWELAGKYNTSQCSVFWHITEHDGSPLKSEQQEGTSASGAAFRAFWHVRRGLTIDDDVFVLATCHDGNGELEDVGDLAAKIAAIHDGHETQRDQRGSFPATIVVAAAPVPSGRTQQDTTSIHNSASWAEVKHVFTTGELSEVRSCAASAALAYLTRMTTILDETPWVQNGERILLSNVHIPPKVWKYELDALWKVTPDRLKKEKKVSVPLADELRRSQCANPLLPIVIIGGAGAGKSCLLRWMAREIAQESQKALNARTESCQNIRWPVIADLAAWTKTEGKPLESLQSAGLAFASMPESTPYLLMRALRQLVSSRLSQPEFAILTHLFLDGLDQVPAGQLNILTKRLPDLASFGSRLLLSSRKSPITTDLPILNGRHCSILEVAELSPEDGVALASKFFGDEIAVWLKSHLHAHPAMSVVAESPLLLTLTCGLITRNPRKELPETAAYLYRDLMLSLAHGQWRDSRYGVTHNPDDAEKLLFERIHPMAWRLFCQNVGTYLFSRDTLMQALSGEGKPIDTKADGDLNELCHLGFLESNGVIDGQTHYSFRHGAFLDFLAAHYLAREINAHGWHARVTHWHANTDWKPASIIDLLDANAFNPAWATLFSFIAGLVGSPKTLLEMLADRKRDDIFRHRLALFCRCYGTLSPDKEDALSDLRDRAVSDIKCHMLATWKRRYGIQALYEQRNWVHNIAHILNLPQAGPHIADLLQSVARADEGSGEYSYPWDPISNNRLISRILAGSAHKSRHSMDALLKLCTVSTHQDLSYEAAEAVVTVANAVGSQLPINLLLELLDASGSTLRQISIAHALLKANSPRTSQRAFAFLKDIVLGRESSTECRHAAIVALSMAGVACTHMESHIIETIMQHLRSDPYCSNDNFAKATTSMPSLTLAQFEDFPGTFANMAELAARGQSDTSLLLLNVLLQQTITFPLLRAFLGGLLISGATDSARHRSGILLMQSVLRDESLENIMRLATAKELLLRGCDADVVAEAGDFLYATATASASVDDDLRAFCVDALLSAGHDYTDKLKLTLHTLAKEASGGFGLLDGPAWLWRAANIAKNHNDVILQALLAPSLTGQAEWDTIMCMITSSFFSLHHPITGKDLYLTGLVFYGVTSSVLCSEINDLLIASKRRHLLLRQMTTELTLRGWRFRISRRKLDILMAGANECCSSRIQDMVGANPRIIDLGGPFGRARGTGTPTCSAVVTH